jgi:hypothetical protein
MMISQLLRATCVFIFFTFFLLQYNTRVRLIIYFATPLMIQTLLDQYIVPTTKTTQFFIRRELLLLKRKSNLEETSVAFGILLKGKKIP